MIRKWKAILTLLQVMVLGAAALAISENAGSGGGQRSMPALMEQGRQALLAGDFKNARDAFSDLLSVDPRNQMACEGATFAYLQLNDYIHARSDLERALGIASPPSRPSAVNGAAIYLHTKKPLRALKVLMDYMSSTSSVDEVALNALEITLNQTDEQSKKSRLYTMGSSFYAAQNKKLELVHPGMKRWGTTWVTADDADQKIKAWNAALASSSQSGRELAILQSHLATVERKQHDPTFMLELAKQNYFRRQTPVTPENELDVDRLKADVTAAQADYDKAIAGAQKPPIPNAIAPINTVAEPPLVLALVIATTGPTTGPSDTVAPATSATTLPATLPTTVASTQPAVATTNPAAPAPLKTHPVTTYAAAFPVGSNLLVTSDEAVADATAISVQGSDGLSYPATLVRADPQAGLALLSVKATTLAYLNLADHFAGGSISCVSFPDVNLFQPTAAIVNGSAPAPGKGWHVHLFSSPRLGGGPLVVAGKVVGVELATRDSDISAIPAIALEDLRAFLAADAVPGGTATDAVAAMVQVSATRNK